MLRTRLKCPRNKTHYGPSTQDPLLKQFPGPYRRDSKRQPWIKFRNITHITFSTVIKQNTTNAYNS